MTERATINRESAQPRVKPGGLLQRGVGMALVRSLLSRTRLLNHVVRSLFKRTSLHLCHHQNFTSSLLLKPTQTLMLAGIRCAGAGGGGPGH